MADGPRRRRWAAAVKTDAVAMVTATQRPHPHPGLGIRTCVGVLWRDLDVTVAQAVAVSARSMRVGTFTCMGFISTNGHRRERATAEPEAEIDLVHVRLRSPFYLE